MNMRILICSTGYAVADIIMRLHDNTPSNIVTIQILYFSVKRIYVCLLKSCRYTRRTLMNRTFIERSEYEAVVIFLPANLTSSAYVQKYCGSR